jgi:hypothetical protein
MPRGASIWFHLHSSIVAVNWFLCALVLAFSPLRACSSFTDLWLVLSCLKRARGRLLLQFKGRPKLWRRGHSLRTRVLSRAEVIQGISVMRVSPSRGSGDEGVSDNESSRMYCFGALTITLERIFCSWRSTSARGGNNTGAEP